jgi:hypothetical protein
LVWKKKSELSFLISKESSLVLPIPTAILEPAGTGLFLYP